MDLTKLTEDLFPDEVAELKAEQGEDEIPTTEETPTQDPVEAGEGETLKEGEGEPSKEENPDEPQKGTDPDLSSVYKDLYDEELAEDPVEEANPVNDFVDQVGVFEAQLTQQGKGINDKIAQLNAQRSQIPQEYQTYNGKTIQDLSQAEISAMQHDIYDQHGEEGVHELQRALILLDEVNKLDGEISEYNQKADAYQWDKAFSDLVKKSPALYEQQAVLEKEVTSILQKVEYKPHDLEQKQKVLKSAIKNVALRNKPVPKAKQTPEADVTPSAVTGTSKTTTSQSVDEIADKVLKGEVNPFEYL